MVEARDWRQRTILVLGQNAVERLQQLHLMVVGLGGVGSHAAESLARLGVGRLTLVDSDRVEITNCNRQLVALRSTLGRAKAEVMAERAKEINPDAQIMPVITRVGPQYPDVITSHKPDGVVDAIDSLDCKIWLLARCHGLQIPVASAMGAGNRVNPARLKIADISETHGCPLAKKVRKGLKEQGITGGIITVFSDEPPVKTGVRGMVGSVSFVPAVMGMMLSYALIRQLIELPGQPS